MRYVTKDELEKDLHALGLRPGALVMLHASVKAVGWVVGGPDVVLAAVLEAIGPSGTLTMMVSTEDGTYEMESWPEERRAAYRAAAPPFDPERTRAFRGYGVLTEYLRTWPGARRSAHPDASFAAVGAKARWLTGDHPLQYGHGPGSPLAKLCEAGGQVLVLGSPLANVTLIHHAEHLARVSPKPVVRYPARVLERGRPVWIEIEEYDTNRPVGRGPDEDYSERIARAYLDSGAGVVGRVGDAASYLLDARSLREFAVRWLEAHRS